MSDTAVHKAIAAGKIVKVDGQIDPDAADAAWARNRDEGQPSKMAENRPQPAGLPAAAPAELPAAQQPAGPPAAPALDLAPAKGTLAAARFDLTTLKAEAAAIELAERKGQLVDVAEVEGKVFGLIVTAKDRLLLIPDKLAPRLGSRTEAECRSILMHEIQEALTEISQYRIAA